MVFGRWWDQMDFEGMYCAMLTVYSSVVSVSILRILGSEAAELPLVATKKEFQGQGYFGALFACIGNLLASLNVKHLVIPATDEAQPMWTQRYGFTKITMDRMDPRLDRQFLMCTSTLSLEKMVILRRMMKFMMLLI